MTEMLCSRFVHPWAEERRPIAEPVGAPTELIGVAEVARRLGVARSTVYARSAAFGAIRLGFGPRAPLRFDWAAVLAALPTAGPRRRRRRRRYVGRRTPGPAIGSSRATHGFCPECSAEQGVSGASALSNSPEGRQRSAGGQRVPPSNAHPWAGSASSSASDKELRAVAGCDRPADKPAECDGRSALDRACPHRVPGASLHPSARVVRQEGQHGGAEGTP